MIRSKLQIAGHSIKYYRKQVTYQILIIALLSAVITGSLLTGSSVKASLKRAASEHLGNTGFLISSGTRYFDPGLVNRLRDSYRIGCTGILEINGYCQNLYSQKQAFNTHIYAVDNDFFSFNYNDSLVIRKGEVAINSKLADYLAVKTGDDLIVRFKQLTDIPADAPFAPSGDQVRSIVLKVGEVLHPSSTGNFSLSISQMVPMNVFMNLSDLEEIRNRVKINRLLINRKSNYSINELSESFKKVLGPVDIGLTIRMIKKTSQAELISDRVFIDAAVVNKIKDLLPSSAPVITYLGNRFSSSSGSTPYSFVSALPSSVYPEIPSGNGMIINAWMAGDLNVREGDSVKMYWFSPDSLNKLIERSNIFPVRKIVAMEGIWSDSLLMPEFPGISGKESCSDWDAGVPVKMKEIRTKDEDYWNKFRGTPKAFINYEKGLELWGNNYGPATSVRFPVGLTAEAIESRLTGSLDPYLTGFTFTDLYREALNAADEGVDFGTLFLSLGFFLIVASIVLLSFAVSSYFDSKKRQVSTLFAMGFKRSWIENLLLLESFFVALTGCIAGAFSGYLVNFLITLALNSVWQGAVQTDTLRTFFTPLPILTGFLLTMLTTMIFMLIKIRRYLKTLNLKEKEAYSGPPSHPSPLLLIVSAVATIILYASSVAFKNAEMTLSFTSGTVLLITLIFAWRLYFSGTTINSRRMKTQPDLSRLYYRFNPSYAVTPVLFIAAGIFAVFITGANKMNFNEKLLNRSAGTGGYLLWCENAIPVKEDLNSAAGKKAVGFDSDSLSSMSFVQIKKSQGNDASCLNLNHIVSPPLLGIDPSDFIAKGSFSFSKVIKKGDIINPWYYLNLQLSANTIYGIADQTVLEWGLKIKTGDTITLRAETGQRLNIIVAAGLKSSVFQGFVLIGKENFSRYFPSVSGSSVLLVDGSPDLTGLYLNSLEQRLENYGPNIEKTTNRLESFYKVTNTYLSVFGIFGALGMVTGIAGLGFVLLRNYNQRKREFALMIASGFTMKAIRSMILSDQLLILFAGVSSGVLSAIVATLPSIKGSPDIPWLFLTLMVLAVSLTGIGALLLSVRSVSADSLTISLKKE